ncbi:hypothetical protein [Sphingomonas sp. PP-CE-1A-559]|uniref:hypothetical protein n=1 Tax=Sphingomonas sp. PP-CE-1A-559 TaxID=2135657 RepID=UPI0014048BA9|nr:hypothetical protein [Sphingomonas sp. PP-CE-1A-559]
MDALQLAAKFGPVLKDYLPDRTPIERMKLADALAALPQTLPAPPLSTEVKSAATGFHEQDVSLKVALPAPGEGMDWSEAHDFTEKYGLPASCVPSLATVAAANDEGVARALKAAAKVADDLCADMTAEADAEPGVITKLLHRASAQTAEKIASAIRLLSQGGGK